jgi:hypothetical protein
MTHRSDLRQLQAVNEYPSVSVLLPTHRTSPDNQQDPIRVKNLVTETKNRLLGKFPAREMEPLFTKLDRVVEGIDQNRAFSLRTPRRCNGSGSACGGFSPQSRAVPSHGRFLSCVREELLVWLEKDLLPGPGIRTVGGDTAFRRERSGAPQA